jgi:hypothetical protein
LRERGMGGIHLCPGCNAVIGTGIRSEKTRSAVQSSNDRRRAKTIADIHGREWHRSCARRLLGERK